MQLLETQQAHARDLEELERLNGSEPGTSSGMRRVMTMGKTTLDDELGDGEAGGTETKTESVISSSTYCKSANYGIG